MARRDDVLFNSRQVRLYCGRPRPRRARVSNPVFASCVEVGGSVSDDTQTDTLMGHVNAIMRALLVAAKRGAPAEGQLPFNPLYFNILRVVGARGRVRPSQIADELSVSRTTISTGSISRRRATTTLGSG